MNYISQSMSSGQVLFVDFYVWKSLSNLPSFRIQNSYGFCHKVGCCACDLLHKSTVLSSFSLGKFWYSVCMAEDYLPWNMNIQISINPMNMHLSIGMTKYNLKECDFFFSSLFFLGECYEWHISKLLILSLWMRVDERLCIALVYPEFQSRKYLQKERTYLNCVPFLFIY